MKKMILKNAVSTYLEERKKLNGRFSQFSNFAAAAVLPCTAEFVYEAVTVDQFCRYRERLLVILYISIVLCLIYYLLQPNSP